MSFNCRAQPFGLTIKLASLVWGSTSFTYKPASLVWGSTSFTCKLPQQQKPANRRLTARHYKVTASRTLLSVAEIPL
jgi:hypothetical protein